MGWQEFDRALQQNHELLTEAERSFRLNDDTGAPTATPHVQTRAWPDAMAGESFHGLAGEIVGTLEPHTEADPAALLVQLLTAFGSVVGSGPHFTVEGDRHGCNLFVVLVGVTSKARKGSSWSRISQLMKLADPEWAAQRVVSGLSSGEGLIWAVHDPIEKRQPVRERGRVVDYQSVVEDEGESDKRLLVLEPELAGPLRAINREGSTLSAVLRQAWDAGNLRALTKNSPARATGAHISIVAHTTPDDLLRFLHATEQANGFANRFLWVCSRRNKVLPHGGSVPSSEMEPIAQRLSASIHLARGTEGVGCDPEADEVWCRVYPDLSEGRPGLLGAMTSRAEAQVMRLAMIYALLDQSNAIQAEHLRAALGVWDYCEASAKYIFGDALGYPEADRILAELKRNPQGLSRTEIRDLFGRNRSEAEIDAALNALAERGLAKTRNVQTDGRPREMWVAPSVSSATKTTETAKGV